MTPPGRCDAQTNSVVKPGRRLELLAERHTDADVQRFSGMDSMGPGGSTSDEDISGEVDQGGPPHLHRLCCATQ
jgi:hypothetical protein